jgi:hypothetical protein
MITPSDNGAVNGLAATQVPKSSDGKSARTDNIARFMSRVVPWPQAGDPGVVNLHWKVSNPKTGKMLWSGRPHTSVDSLVGLAKWAVSRPNIKDMYFCLSLQAKTAPSRNGKVTVARTAEDALLLKSIWLDIDVKDPPKGYATAPDALNALKEFLKSTNLPFPTAIVKSGGGLHVYWISKRPLTVDEWRPYAEGLKAAVLKHGLRCDAGLTTDAARILRVPETLNYKTEPPKPVELIHLAQDDYDFEQKLNMLPPLVPGGTQAVTVTVTPENVATTFTGQKPADAFAHLDPNDRLSAGIKHDDAPLNPAGIFASDGCLFFRDAFRTHGKNHSQPLWNLTILASTFLHNGEKFAHELGSGHPGYTPDSTDAMFARKLREHQQRGLGWPLCTTFEGAGCEFCKTCPHKGKIKSPLNLRPQQSPAVAPPIQPSFVDPFADFVGPDFPLEVLPPTLVKFVEEEHCAMGADPSAIAMAALTVVSGAMNAETRVRAAEGWLDRQILWTALVGQPSTMKSPIITKTTKPLSRLDHEREKQWRQGYAIWQQNQKVTKKTVPPPAKLARCVINDATPEKIAEILSREASGSLMVHDELAGWFESFERYNSGSSRSFYLSCWNGGSFQKDRVAKGSHDPAAEIHVDNLALSILGGIQPDRLAKLRDLTSDGLLQRFLPVLMKSSERGNEYHFVAIAEDNYEKLIKSINSAKPSTYHFDDEALEVRDRVFNYLHGQEKVDEFPSALIGAIGKLRGYFARLCLVLEVAQKHDPLGMQNGFKLPLWATREEGERWSKLLGIEPNDDLSAGINPAISRWTAQAAERIIREFLLPHIFGLYDVLVNGGQDRETLRAIGNFILASDKDRLRPSDVTAGVRALRGQPEKLLGDWMGRFCAMGWLQPEENKAKPWLPPKAWLVEPGLRKHFAERREEAKAARAAAHAILKAGGSRRTA